MNKLVLRQLRSTVLLLIALVLILSLAFYLHWTNSFVEEIPATNATHEDISEALIRYKSLPEGEMAQLHTASISTVCHLATTVKIQTTRNRQTQRQVITVGIRE